MATTTHVPVEVYLRSSYEPDAEYVDGKIEERPMGEFDHASWQLAILKWFLQHEKEWGIRVLPELRVRVAATRYRVPDVTVLDRSRPSNRSSPTRRSLCLRFFLPKTGYSVSNGNWKTIRRWASRKYGSSIRRTARFTAMRICSSSAMIPSLSPKKASSST